MNRQILTNDKITEQTEVTNGIHLIMATVISIFGLLLIFITCVLSWELWTLPLIIIGMVMVWALHIGKFVSEKLYEAFCVGLILIEFFYYGAHATSLFDMPIVVCIVLFMLSTLNNKLILHLLASMYVLALLYQCIFLHTIRLDMPVIDFARLGLGIIGTASALLLARYTINQRKTEMRQIRELAIQLENARQQNADFLSNISHELRTPINMVTGISAVALNKQLSPELQEDLQSIQLAGKRLAGQINDILDYTEIVSNTLVSVDEQYMVPSVLNDVISMLAVQNKKNHLEIVYDIDVRIPYMLKGDSEKLCRVLKILLDNAIKFTAEGGIYMYIGFRTEEYGINLNIDICDTGVGMSTSQLYRICDDFYQADSSRSRIAGGLGLGLSIAHGLLRSMGGFMHFESREKEGTKVHVSIPQGVADARPCMTLKNPERFCIAGYFKADKYTRHEVREYYDRLIYHMAVGLGIEGHRVYHFEELQSLRQNHKLTHLFIAPEEYEENSSYYEELGKEICVAIIAGEEFSLNAGSSLVLICKPVSPLPLVNLLNGETHGMMDNLTFSCKGTRALVVDDEEMNLVVAKGVLSDYGMTVDTCPGGEEAVEHCMVTAYDIIFLDHMMPRIDGIETLKRIRGIKGGLYQDLPIIALTANAISGAREMFKQEGFTEFVPKPIERPVLERALRRVLPAQLIHYDYVSEPENIQEPPAAQMEIPQEPELTQETEAPAANPQPPSSLSMTDRLQQGGINVDSGLKYCSGSEEFYTEMLKMFYDQSHTKREEIIQLYEEGNLTDYAIKIHALKSTSRTIGADNLSEQAKTLEQAGKDNDAAYIKENHPAMLQLYETTCRLIADTLSLENDQREDM